MPAEPLRYFRALAGRGLARAKAPPELTRIETRYDQGWLLCFTLASGEKVAIDARPEGSGLRYAYRKPGPSPNQRKLERAGLLLCKALAAVELGPPPPVELRIADPSEGTDKRGGLFMYLPGECDRRCKFCSINLEPPPIEDAPGLGDRVRARLGLPMAREPLSSPASLAGFAERLRSEADRADEITVAWSGQDCLASPMFDELLGLAHELGYSEMTIQTPGTRLLEPGFLDFLWDHGVRGLGLTAHADDADDFDRIGGKPGAARMFWAALEALEPRVFDVSVEVPLIAETAAGLPRLLARLLEYSVGPTVFYWYPEEAVADAFAELSLPFDAAIDALDRARERVPAGRVGVDGIPLCVAPEHLSAHYRWLYGRHMESAATEALELCRGCAVADSCPGASTVYRETYGWPDDAEAL